jgi:hypothetical protein
MSDPLPSACGRCSKPLSEAEYQEDRAMLLLGSGYCNACLEAMTPTCHRCRKALHESDFPQGRAVTLQGVRFCEECMEEAVRATPTSPLLRVEKPDWGGRTRRAAARFVPPQDAGLFLKPLGLKGLFRSNLVRLWVDVSEGGLRCVVQRGPDIGDLMYGRFTHPELNQKLEFRGMVRHARPSTKYPGAALIGIRFEEPSYMLLAFVRDVLARDPGMLTLTPPTPKPRPPSTRSA